MGGSQKPLYIFMEDRLKREVPIIRSREAVTVGDLRIITDGWSTGETDTGGHGWSLMGHSRAGVRC